MYVWAIEKEQSSFELLSIEKEEHTPNPLSRGDLLHHPAERDGYVSPLERGLFTIPEGNGLEYPLLRGEDAVASGVCSLD